MLFEYRFMSVCCDSGCVLLFRV